MKEMKRVVLDISDAFASEATASPRMLEDLAAMERYMAESYDGRTFVELIQNADDARSDRIAIRLIGTTLVVANDGRPFDESDILAISRSGASNKRRGDTIGYRGVGFKSATSFSTEIVIISGGACFTFSKEACSRRLGMSVDRVPTVRIPFPYDERDLPRDVSMAVEELLDEGFTTFFIFLSTKVDKVVRELSDFEEGWLLFLRSVHDVAIHCGPLIKHVAVTRNHVSDSDSLLRVDGSNKCWYVTASADASLAFQYEDGRGVIPCDTNDAVFHCFMPTLDKTGFPFKVNADFSTDPSRKHIISDASTEAAMAAVQSLVVETIVKATSNKMPELYPILTLLGVRTSLSTLSSQFELGLLEGLRRKSWVPVRHGGLVCPESVKILPRWLDAEEGDLLSAVDGFVSDSVLDHCFANIVPKVETLLFRLGATELLPSDLLFFLEVSNKNTLIPIPTLAKLFAHLYRTSGGDGSISRCYIPLENGGSILLKETTRESNISSAFLSGIKGILNSEELASLSLQYDAFAGIDESLMGGRRGKTGAKSETVGRPEAPVISRWKTPAQNCMAIEIQAGNSAKKAGAKCSEYDVVSTGPDGFTSYIAAKSVGSLGDSFRMSEAEYEAAKRYGDHYKVCLFSMGEGDMEYAVIINPASGTKAKKVVKEWEWVIEGYLVEDRNNQRSGISDEAIEAASSLDVDFDDFDGDQFERFCARLLLRNGYQNVKLTKASGDQGIDVIAYRDGIKYGIQCKCYKSDVGNDAVQEAYAGKKYYQCNVAIVMTNRRFTPSATKLAESNNVILWGREMVMKMINSAK